MRGVVLEHISEGRRSRKAHWQLRVIQALHTHIHTEVRAMIAKTRQRREVTMVMPTMPERKASAFSNVTSSQKLPNVTHALS